MLVVSKKKRDTFDAIIWGIFIVCLLVGISSFDDRWYDFTVNKFTVFPIDDQGRAFSVAYNFTAPVFAVNQDIHVSIVARPSVSYIQNFPDEVKKQKDLYVYFIGVTTKDDIYVDGVKRSPTLWMEKEANGWYRGEYTLKYDEEGNKCFRVDIKRVDGLPTYCKTSEEPMLIISPYSDKLQFQSNKIFMVLTFVILGVSIISAREPLRDILRIPRKQE